MTEYASLSKYRSKNVQVVIQVVNSKKVMAKTPREANLYGNWCVRKGLRKVLVSGFRLELRYGAGLMIREENVILMSPISGLLVKRQC